MKRAHVFSCERAVAVSCRHLKGRNFFRAFDTSDVLLC